MKEAYSAWSKMGRKRVGRLEELNDLIGLRVVFTLAFRPLVPRAEFHRREHAVCSRVLRIVHAHLPPTRPVKDYVAAPKRNGYRSMHSVVELGLLRAQP